MNFLLILLTPYAIILLIMAFVMPMAKFWRRRKLMTSCTEFLLVAKHGRFPVYVCSGDPVKTVLGDLYCVGQGLTYDRTKATKFSDTADSGVVLKYNRKSAFYFKKEIV